MTPRMLLAVRVWPWVLALAVLFPVLAPGYVLSYDMVFVPDLALRSDFLGLGSGLPRAVPSDAVVAVVDELVPGMVLQKLLLVGALVLAGAGARRLVPAESGVAQLAATSLYVWNPYVAERLGIGHWPVLLAYAALPWIADAARRLRAGERALPALTLWLALSALSISGGVMGALTALAFLVGPRRADVRRLLSTALLAFAVNLPWLVAGLLHASGGRTDPAGVEAFATRGEGPLSLPLTLLGLGGIWNTEVVPASRTGWTAVVALVVVAAVCLAGLRTWLAWTSLPGRAALLGLGAVGLLVGVAGAVAPGPMADLVASLPGAGLLRDGSRFIGLLALLEASLFGAGTQVLSRVRLEPVGRWALVGGAVLAPIALMPDLAAGLAGRLDPVSYPEEYAAAREVLADAADQQEGSLLVLPFTSYRVPAWNEGRRTLDPLGRYLTVNYLASDELFVSGARVTGEDERGRRVRESLDAGLSADVLASELASEGIRWVVLDREAQTAFGTGTASAVPAGQVLHDGERLSVRELRTSAAAVSAGSSEAVVAVLGWGVWAATLTGAAAVAAGRRRRTGHRRGESDTKP